MMHFGTQTGSLINHLYSRMDGGDPEIGMGATILRWSDRDAATVTAWDANKQIVELRQDRSTCIDFDMQTYVHERSEFGATYYFRREKNGSWVQVFLNRITGRWIKNKGNSLILGRRDHYRDPSF